MFFKRIKKLEDKVCELEKKIEEFQRRTISQKTLEKDPPPTTNQILDEWLNGKEEGDGN